MAQKRALITGVTGQDGSYLAELLLQKGYEVHGIVRRASTFNRGRIDHIFESGDKVPFKLHYGDLADSSSLLHIILEVQPDEIYNLAAQSHVGISFDLPEYTGDVTGIGCARLLEALRTSKVQSKFYQASSSELYGKVMETPQRETTPFYPRSPYACAKAYSFYLTRNYRESYGMFAVNGILFNHESPRRGENFVTRKITLSIARILAGLQSKMMLGNLDAKRDWGFAQEYVEGMWRMLQHTEPDDFVLATGQAIRVRDFLELCLTIAGIPFERRGEGMKEEYVDTRTGNVIVGVHEQYYRPADVELLIGDASKAKQVLGWEPKTDLPTLARLMMEADAKHIGVQLPA